MYSIIKHLYHGATGAIKLLSTENGRIKLQTINDVEIYGHTQGVFYFSYESKEQYAEYYILLAELMRSENRHRWAARCYLKALEKSWEIYTHTTFYNEKYKNHIDPYEVYKVARLHLLEIDNANGLKKLKETHQRCREYDHAEKRYSSHLKRKNQELAIENTLSKYIAPEFG